MFRILDEPPVRQDRAPTPPPAYDEVTKQPRTEAEGISDVKIDINELPPDYALAVAMSQNENVPKDRDQEPPK